MTTKRAPHVLRTLRQRYEWSQSKLATLVGCTLATVKKIEAGKLRPSAQLAQRVYMQTGLDPYQLMANRSPETPRHPAGAELTKDTLASLQSSHREAQTREHVDASLEHYRAILTVLLDASVQQKQFWAVRPAFQQAVEKILDDFELNAQFGQTLFERYRVKTPWLGPSPMSDLYTIVNAKEGARAIREEAERRRVEFYSARMAKLSSHVKPVGRPKLISDRPRRVKLKLPELKP